MNGTTHFDERMQREIGQIRDAVRHMGQLCETAIRLALRALRERDRQAAFSAILRDQRIDEMEVEIDRLCLEFLVRQQPAGGPLRMVYGTIRITLELERIGDYAESIARHTLRLIGEESEIPTARYGEMAELTLQMLRDAVEAYASENEDLARRTIAADDAADEMKRRLNRDLVKMFRDQQLPFEVLDALMMITRRFERISDQARNICLEVLFMRTGAEARHPHSGRYRVLFVDSGGSCRSLMAEAAARSQGAERVEFASASVDPAPLPSAAAEFLLAQGATVGLLLPAPLLQAGDLETYSVIVALDPNVRAALPRALRKAVVMDWAVPDPSASPDDPASYGATWSELRRHIEDLLRAIEGEDGT